MPGLNKNVKKVRKCNQPYMHNILASGHGSVLEHATVTLAFHNVSRVFTHELVRHRVGTAMSQESMRYIRTEELAAYWPMIGFGKQNLMEIWDAIPDDVKAADDYLRETSREEWAEQQQNWLRNLFMDMFWRAEETQRRIASSLHLDDIDDFGCKKKATSATRRMLPDGMATTIVWTANHRTLRHTIAQRTSRHAEEEIRLVFGKIYELLHIMFPNIYQDGEVEWVDSLMEVTFEHGAH